MRFDMSTNDKEIIKAYLDHIKDDRCMRCSKIDHLQLIGLRVEVDNQDDLGGWADGLVCLCSDCYVELIDYLNIPTVELDTSKDLK